jgi:hypothetical protein
MVLTSVDVLQTLQRDLVVATVHKVLLDRHFQRLRNYSSPSFGITQSPPQMVLDAFSLVGQSNASRGSTSLVAGTHREHLQSKL